MAAATDTDARASRPSAAVSAQYPVGCDTCDAQVGDPCRSRLTRRVTDTHTARLEAAARYRDPYADRGHVFEHLLAILTREQALRDQRPGTRSSSMDTLGRDIVTLEWIAAEHNAMRNAVNDLRVERGLKPIYGDVIARVEEAARGHSDYAKKYALGCAALVPRA